MCPPAPPPPSYHPQAILSPYDGALMDGPSVGLPHIVSKISHWTGAEKEDEHEVEEDYKGGGGGGDDIRPDEEKS